MLDDIAHVFLEDPVDFVRYMVRHLPPCERTFTCGVELNQGVGLGAEAVSVHLHHFLNVGEAELGRHHVMRDGADLAAQTLQQ